MMASCIRVDIVGDTYANIQPNTCWVLNQPSIAFSPRPVCCKWSKSGQTTSREDMEFIIISDGNAARRQRNGAVRHMEKPCAAVWRRCDIPRSRAIPVHLQGVQM